MISESFPGSRKTRKEEKPKRLLLSKTIIIRVQNKKVVSAGYHKTFDYTLKEASEASPVLESVWITKVKDVSECWKD